MKPSISVLRWGTYGLPSTWEDGIPPPVEYKMLWELSTDHIRNILRTESWHMGDLYEFAFMSILLERQLEGTLDIYVD